jgi:competence protein ComFC
MKLLLFILNIKDFLLDILFPIKCLGCQSKNVVICDNCIAKIRIAERETDKNILAVFDYRDPIIKKAIWELKYYHKRYLGRKLGQLLYEFLVEDISDIRTYALGRPILVIPVPISKKKTLTRGYNQSLAIAKGFCNSSTEQIFELKDKIVIKKVETLPQARITNRKRRLENIKGVFEIKNKDEVKGRTIIIIDDVTTTGGTINEISKILKKSGAKKVIGFTIAH